MTIPTTLHLMGDALSCIETLAANPKAVPALKGIIELLKLLADNEEITFYECPEQGDIDLGAEHYLSVALAAISDNINFTKAIKEANSHD